MDTVVRAFILCSEQEAQTRAPDESPCLCCSRPSTLLRKRHLSQFQRNRSHCTFLKTHLSLLPCHGAERKADYLCLTCIISSDSVDRRFQVRGLDCFAYHGISAAWHSAWNLAGDQWMLVEEMKVIEKNETWKCELHSPKLPKLHKWAGVPIQVWLISVCSFTHCYKWICGSQMCCISKVETT